MNKGLISKEIRKLNQIIQPVNLKLGRYHDDLFLADDKGHILIRKISQADYLYLKHYFKEIQNRTK